MTTHNVNTGSAIPSRVNDDKIRPPSVHNELSSLKEQALATHEVFKDTEDGVQFRTVSWQSATIMFLKIQFAMSILSVPGAFATLGAVGGALSLVGWHVLNTYTAVILGEFRNRHPECHNRPAVAPPGDFDLGWTAIAHPTFVAGITASANIFISNSGSSMYLPIISEMRRPDQYRKAALVTGVLVLAMYLSFSLVIYRWCGVWLATPAFGSAGPLFKKISYGVALPGLIIGVGIYQHVAAKYLFVRILRDSQHLQANTVIHWTSWIGSNMMLGILAFIVAEAVPILNYLLGLAGALCFAPFSLIFPALLWMQDFSSYRKGGASKKAMYGFHVFIVLVGLFMVVAGTYSVAVSIKDAYASGLISKVFNCADNSGTIS
ncbi:hypothetical protein CSAL01_09680 [Colletotrichum salicis]|uniref:Amino acid transporter transmembrane domain-containing protein n=1 Tax=Colletotrichum salicis TaxID=1209931 RepID=A0A135TDB6_9PEZI|nr:hypothetical protein CSAL01_09680 [Colletotrichum salicis]